MVRELRYKLNLITLNRNLPTEPLLINEIGQATWRTISPCSKIIIKRSFKL
jgi:hypothetical protein